MLNTLFNGFNRKLTFAELLGFTCSLLIIILGLIKLSYAFHVPIYPDEINWRVIYTRYLLDNGSQFHYIKPCQTGSFNIPIYASFAMFVLGLFHYIVDYFWIRFVPTIFLLALLVTFYISLGERQRYNFKILYFSICLALILTPVGYIWYVSSRPEFFLFGYISIFLLLTRFTPDNRDRQKIYGVFLLLIYWSVCAVAHPKALYLLIFNIILIQKYVPGLWYRLALNALVIVYAVLIAKFDQMIIFNCDSLPQFLSWYKSLNANPLEIFSTPKEFLAKLLQDIPPVIEGLLTRAPENLSYLPYSDIQYLPSVTQTGAVRILNHCIWDIYCINLIFPFYALTHVIKNKVNVTRSENLYLLIYLFVFLNISLNRTQNAYDVAFWYLLLIITNSIYVYDNIKLNKSYVLAVSMLAGSIFALSTYVHATNIDSVFKSSWSIGAFAGPSAPKKYFTKNHREEMQKDFKDNCYAGNDLILFDDRTYLALQAYHNLAPITYTMYPFSHNGQSQNVKDSVRLFLNSNYKSPVLYSACEFAGELPDSFKLKYRNESLHLCCFNFQRNK